MRVKPAGLPLVLAVLCLAGARVSAAAVLRAGPGGDYPTIQAAIDAARARGGANEIHVAQGRWRERLLVGDLGIGGSLSVVGGYADDFESFSTDAAGTVLDGSGTGPVLDVTITFGAFVLSGVTVENGGRHVPGDTVLGSGGGRVFAAGEAEVRFRNVVFRDNTVAAQTSAIGAGLLASLADESLLELLDCRFEHNTVSRDSGYVDGGGAWITATNRAQVRVAGSTFRGNAVRGGANASGSGLFLDVLESATAALTDNSFVENEITPGPRAAALTVRTRGDATPARLVARRSRFLGNRGGQLRVGIDAGGTVFSDTLIAEGDRDAVSAYVAAGERLLLTNLTVVGQAGAGVDGTYSTGTVVLANSLVFGNHPDIRGPVDTRDSNLVGVDPLFAGAGNYHVQARSPAIDTGHDAPEGGLGPLDLDRFDRARGAAVDRGAYEGPPGCRVLWPLSDPSTPGCRCVSETGLRALRCVFMLPDVFLAADVPFESWPPREVLWTIHPWTDVEGSYSMSTLASVGQKWRTQRWLGPKATELKRDQPVGEPFALEFDADGPVPLRTTLVYRAAGRPEPQSLEVELVLERQRRPGK